jgi:hypothetical protein
MFMLGAILYGVSAVIWFSIISTEQLSTAYSILVSMTFILVTGGSDFTARTSAVVAAMELTHSQLYRVRATVVDQNNLGASGAQDLGRL